MTTDTKAALLRAVCEAPGDDLPRLAYADWLEEYGGQAGELVAEYIRRSIGLYRGDRWNGRQALDAFEASVRETVATNHLWQGLTVRGASLGGVSRGFVRCATVHTRWLFGEDGRAAWLFRRAPIVQVIVGGGLGGHSKYTSSGEEVIPGATRFPGWLVVPDRRVDLWTRDHRTLPRRLWESPGLTDAQRERYGPIHVEPWSPGLEGCPGAVWHLFRNEAVASEALSLCLVNRGRMLAGLPPL